MPSKNPTIASKAESISSLKEFTTYIPIRLTPHERALLNVLESTLHVSEYTDNIDVSSSRYGGGYSNYSGGIRTGGLKVKKILDNILEACHVATGLAVVGALDHPSHLIADMNISGKNPKREERSNFSQLSLKNDAATGAAGFDGNADADTSGHKTKKMSKQKEKAQKKLLKKLKKKQAQQRAAGKIVDAASVGIGNEDKNDAGKNDNIDSVDDDMNPAIADPTSNTGDENTSPANPYENISSIAALQPKQNGHFFQQIFEVGRRNKVLNPSKMRATYGKLMHLLQDAQSPSIARSLGFSLYKDLVMVRPFLEGRGVGDILEDERLVGATSFVHTRDESGDVVDRGLVDEAVRRKKDLVDELLEDYSSNENGESNATISKEELLLCIESISDAIAVVESNVAPVKRMIHLLEKNFSTGKCEKNFSLELRGSGNSFSSSNRYGGYGFGAFGSSFSRDSSGPTLSHSHPTQYTFVWQSLNLWKEVQSNMHRLWVCADDDLLSTTTSYQLLNTGQGLNRVQSCPKVGRLMRHLLSKTQKAANAPWVGLSVIHLGDRDVPNALVFIDKYTQIPRFLSPIVDFIDGIPEICMDERIESYINEQFGSERNLKMSVLADYFKHGFDGSGDDGGSCIDGRLTSSWNWTSRIVKKNYYHAFMLSGFQGFDGDFK